MATPITINEGQHCLLDAKVHSLTVSVGRVVVTANGVSVVVDAGTTKVFDTANVDVLATQGSRVQPLYDHEVASAPVQRGDSGGDGGSYEARTAKELRKLASERGVPGASKLNKADLIEALRS